jgi:predicted dinucleotide-binding enzyme
MHRQPVNKENHRDERCSTRCGALGAAIAARLSEDGFDVRLWNRTLARAERVAAESDRVVVAGTAAAAVEDAEVVLTVLRDGTAVAAVAEEMSAVAIADVLKVLDPRPRMTSARPLDSESRVE